MGKGLAGIAENVKNATMSRQQKVDIAAEGMLEGDPLAYFRKRINKGKPKGKKGFKKWQREQAGLRSMLVEYVNSM